MSTLPLCFPVLEARSGTVVKALCYKPEGREFDSRLSLEFFADIILFYQQIGLEIEKENNKMLHLEHWRTQWGDWGF
jgi:hypothetical protein